MGQIKISAIADRQTLAGLGFRVLFPSILKSCSSASSAMPCGVTARGRNLTRTVLESLTATIKTAVAHIYSITKIVFVVHDVTQQPISVLGTTDTLNSVDSACARLAVHGTH